MGVHSLALSLLLLAFFTFSSVVFFEIFAQPPVVKQERELFISAFTSDQLSTSYKYDEQSLGVLRDDEQSLRLRYDKPSSGLIYAEPSLRYKYDGQIIGKKYTSDQSPPQYTKTSSILLSTPNGRMIIGENVQEGKRRRSVPYQLSTLKSEMKTSENSNAGTKIKPKLTKIPMQQNRRRGMHEYSPAYATKMVWKDNNTSTPAARMQVSARRPKVVQPKLDQVLRHRYVNRNNISAMKYSATRGASNMRPPMRPRRMGLNCTDPYCVSYLLDQDYRSFTVCQQWAEKKTKVDHRNINAKCKFMKGVKRAPVGLVSVPGSGNTWVRGLLEKATGICTGSIYCDHPLRNSGMIGEYVNTGRVIVVKTHTSDYQWLDVTPEKQNNDDGLYGSAILLIRNPFNAFIAEWNRLNALSAYTGQPIEPRKRLIGSRLKPVSNYHSRQESLLPLSKVNRTRSLINKQKYYSQTTTSNSHGQTIEKLKNHTQSMQLHNEMLNDDSRQEHSRVSATSRKLLALQPNKLKEDVSHTVEIDKKMFGKTTPK